MPTALSTSQKFFFSSVLVHCLMDVVILVLPIFPVCQMHLSWAKSSASSAYSRLELCKSLGG